MTRVWGVLATALAVVVLVGGCGDGGKDGASGSAGKAARDLLSDDAPEGELEAGAVDWQPPLAISVSGLFTVDHEGTVVRAQIDAAGRIGPAYPYLGGGDWPLDPHPVLRAGKPMKVTADALPVCDGKEHNPPVITVTSRTPDGEIRQDRFAVVQSGYKSVPETADYIDKLTRQFCALGLTARLSGSSGSADGQTGSVKYAIRNPGPDDVTVTSRAWSSDGARWLEATADIPGDGQEHVLVVHGDGGICARQEIKQGPLLLGLLSGTRPDGRTVDVSPEGAHGDNELICGA
jgi:hypothetical protein